MSNYWKQSLVIGGIYWLVSLFLKLTGIWWVLLIDLGLSVFLLLFLIPMKWLVPIKKVDNCINKHPIISTMLASVGWMPYFTAIIFIIASIAAMFVYYDVASLENMSGVFLFTGFMVRLEKFTALIIVVLTIIMLIGYRKSIAGPLSKYCSCKKEKASSMTEAKNIKSLKETVVAKTKKVASAKKAKPTKKAVAKKGNPVKKVASAKKTTTVKKANSGVKKASAPIKKKAVKKTATSKKSSSKSSKK